MIRNNGKYRRRKSTISPEKRIGRGANPVKPKGTGKSPALKRRRTNGKSKKK